MGNKIDKSEWPMNMCREILMDDEITEENLSKDYCNALENVMDSVLTEREKQVVWYRYQVGLPYQKIGEKFGVGLERARQISDTAILRMRSFGAEMFLREGISSIEEAVTIKTAPLGILGISQRLQGCLIRAGIRTVGQLLECTEEDLLRIRNFGPAAYKELKDSLEKHGFKVFEDLEVFKSVPNRASIRVLELSTHLRTCLNGADICTVGHLLECTRTTLLGIRNLGSVSIKELESKLEQHGLKLREEGQERNRDLEFLISAPLIVLELSTHLRTCLNWAGIHTVGQLLECTEEDLLRIRNFGGIPVWELEDALEKYGLKLREE